MAQGYAWFCCASNSSTRFSNATNFSRVRINTCVCTSNSSRVTKSSFANCACNVCLSLASASCPKSLIPCGRESWICCITCSIFFGFSIIASYFLKFHLLYVILLQIKTFFRD
ncbi:unknown [Pasteurella multocida subsp. multocida str. Pm70]|uniref:Uncharacterized protein PM1386 n=1 Tax=Pasteurella multocida (strain Pm70) TaxID=272843 RepID=Y1386_PASMU|nr:RecName: Full=Uncharacterized protein PM1386 [Pasteurella multocida subsp. multocida str. Pm70]AAK03470.1 unknown [Pasteurella multocida subsp. multocida str. Pm70]